MTSVSPSGANTVDGPATETATTAPNTTAPIAGAAAEAGAATPVKFSDFGLAPELERAVAELGYQTPTPIQAQAIPVVLTGRDVMGAAQTGTGKTAGFALPILQRLLPHANASASPARHPVRALILAPTRELADQIYVNTAEYAKYTPIKCAVVYGGVDMDPQIAALRSGCEVLIATPGRLLDHVGRKTVNLGQAQVLVLDEADRMLDMGFLPDIQRIINLLPPIRQNLMFSATFSDEIKRLSASILRTPALIEVARRNAAAENVELQVFKVESADAKRAAVAKVIREKGLAPVIVFTNTKIGASRLARQLERDGLNAAAIHGDRSQLERQKTLDDFKAGRVMVLVATDVAARGLDIVELPAVINYDVPRAPEDYIHRIGRTGRAGASGVAVTLIAPGDERYLADIEKLIRRKLIPQQLSIEPQAITRSREGPRYKSERVRDRHGSSAMPRRAAPPEDPLFSAPYEASAAPADAQPAPPAASGPKRVAKRVAVLLGGAGVRSSNK